MTLTLTLSDVRANSAERPYPGKFEAPIIRDPNLEKQPFLFAIGVLVSLQDGWTPGAPRISHDVVDTVYRVMKTIPPDVAATYSISPDATGAVVVERNLKDGVLGAEFARDGGSVTLYFDGPDVSEEQTGPIEIELLRAHLSTQRP